ncbi:30S ribosomal protein S20 [Elioraea tepida]|jgi:small subunit ribosomal protein S20|uniref:Small ribosomal subunit protein bS20 n=1 Tax=Elioraea tepida TaxID=2843330 RepID=A0A975U262_9PROT|nr:30S ribosomal protein S20 [Elioraea tepida]QXM23751.1 30S ribosomal protein S20 [Elioraea tepida]
MANTASAQKRIRQTARRTARNRSAMSRLRTFVKKVENAIRSGATEEARAALNALKPELMRAASKGLVHRNLVARKLSRLSRRVRATEAG